MFVEKRGEARYEINGTVSVTEYLDEGKAYRLHSPQDAELVNISRGGIRIRMKTNSLSIDDMVHIVMDIGNRKKQLNARVVNIVDAGEHSDYGCMLF